MTAELDIFARIAAALAACQELLGRLLAETPAVDAELVQAHVDAAIAGIHQCQARQQTPQAGNLRVAMDAQLLSLQWAPYPGALRYAVWVNGQEVTQTREAAVLLPRRDLDPEIRRVEVLALDAFSGELGRLKAVNQAAAPLPDEIAIAGAGPGPINLWR